MPLEELLALYGYTNSKEKDSSSESELEEEDNTPEEQICEPLVEKERSPTPPKQSKLSLLYETMTEEGDDSRLLRSVSRISEYEEDEYESNAEDDDYRKIKKTIMVGSDYQAQIPEGLNHYDNAPPYENDDKLLWNPEELISKNVEDFLRRAHEITKPPIPKGTLLRDDEQALYVLQQCGYNTEEALRRLRMNVQTSPAISTGKETLWSEEECRNFESGVRAYGKNFHLIQHNKVRTRSVGELVQFYYLWKKTERHDIFANKVRLEKKKYALHPGLTDFMDRFLEDQDKDRSSSPCVLPGSGSVNGKPPDT
ncbi:mesoderm induction early response protein 1 isoform X3 [Rhynchophorus ferrugineus]